MQQYQPPEGDPTTPYQPYSYDSGSFSPAQPSQGYPPAPSHQPTQPPGYQPTQPPGGQLEPYPYGQPTPLPLGHGVVDPRYAGYPVTAYQVQQKSRLAAGLLGIFLGTLGVHNFYLGRTAVAVIQLLISVLSIGILAPIVAIWALIEGIMILAGSASFRTDARGIPLRD